MASVHAHRTTVNDDDLKLSREIRGDKNKNKGTQILVPIYNIKKNFTIYIYRIVKKIQPSIGISPRGKLIVNNLSISLLGRLLHITESILALKRKYTISVIMLKAAVGILIPGNMADEATDEATKAVKRYESSNGPKRSKSHRAGLTFSVARTLKYMRIYAIGYRIGVMAQIYITAIIDYVVSKILHLAEKGARDYKIARITPRSLTLAIRNNDDLNILFTPNSHILGGGVVPRMNKYY